MSNLLILVIDGDVKIKYDRAKPIAGLQHVQYVANHVVNSFLNNKQQAIAIDCAYPTKAAPELKQITLESNTSHQSISLLFNETTTKKLT